MGQFCDFRKSSASLAVMQGIPDRVLSLIEASGLSRGAFAQEIGLDDSKLSKSLSGTRRFSSLDLARIADRCHVTVDWLVTGEEPPLAVAARTTSGDARTGAGGSEAVQHDARRPRLAWLAAAVAAGIPVRRERHVCRAGCARWRGRHWLW